MTEMIDLDDVGDGFAFGGIIFGLIILAIYLIFSRPAINECEKAGGVMVKANGTHVCVSKDALINPKVAPKK